MRSNKSMKFNIVTIFPNELSQSLSYGVIGNAIRDNIIKINYLDPRIHSDNKHDSIDDKPYGGGPGMVMQAKPVIESIEQARDGNSDIPVYLPFSLKERDLTKRRQKSFLSLIKS